MQLHQLRPINKTRKKKRIGRGGAHGFYSGKGAKGQKSRAGRKFKPIIRELIKRYPKLRGYKFKGLPKNQAVLNTGVLEYKFEAGEKISPETLIKKKLISKINGMMPKVKILGKGEIKKALIFEGVSLSKGAKEKIKKAGGEIK